MAQTHPEMKLEMGTLWNKQTEEVQGSRSRLDRTSKDCFPSTGGPLSTRHQLQSPGQRELK